MGNKKRKDNARKRKLADEDVKKIEIDMPKKRSSPNDVQKTDAATSDTEKLVILPTRESHAEQLFIAIQNKQLAVVEGSIGCGKTFLVRHLAQKMGLTLKSMQMGDQVDSKTLFGSYHCTEVAGQFKWKPSNFSQWLAEPCIILLEDIDMANPDVLSLFVELVNDRIVTLPSGEAVSFHENVRLVATMSGKGKKNSVLEGVPVKISLEPLTDAELRRLVTDRFPRCAHLARTLTSIFRDVESVPTTANSRPLTSTDLLRGCARVNGLCYLSSNIAIFTELVDVWCLADQPERSRILCEKVASHLTITEDQLAFHLSMRQPSFSHDDLSCTVGRAKLQRSPTLKITQKHRLGHTTDVLQLMERIAVCVESKEAVLLVGETGVGKTSVVQTLANNLNVTLKVVNLSPTSDSDELIQGYKPTTVAHILEPFTQFYHKVFTSNFDAEKNKKFLSHLETCLSSGRYRDYLTVVESTAKKALASKDAKSKVNSLWAEVLVRSRRIRDGLEKNAAPFAITRGAVLEAAQEGYWLLIDEINLAPPECLDAIVHAISSSAHPNFRLFACMNPATDAGKRRLPTGVRTKFTEFYVSEMVDRHQLALVVSAYLPSMKATAVENLVKFYLQAKQQFPGSYSLRTLCRALLFAGDNLFGSEDRSLFEAVCMAFLTNLDVEDKMKMRAKIQQTFRVATNIAIPAPSDENQFVQVEGYWIERGTELPKEDTNYVITKTVKENLAEIGRIVCSGRFPVLLEGETSAGKTSIVCHLAKVTGNRVTRINNHEHTDVQEYMGSYVADESGRLVFREGALVKAVRDGSWVILDELNLAPTDVIEALNRLLDDNRELFVPELNQTIRAHPRFRLFATQNPAGTYSGRKRLSRALLSRFIVLRFHHLPMDELSSMVCTRCGIHASAATKMIAVLSDLRVKRSLSGLFSARDGLMTLRDVFRWAKRLATDETCDDWLQILANHGYFLLAGRCRNKKDDITVVESLERILKRKIEVVKLFSVDSPYFPSDVDTKNIILTTGMRRMLVMTHQAWIRDESVLMVGETGGGKTSLAEVMGRGKLLTINCHERTETADLLGRLRPKDGGGFEWSDGIVISAMRSGAPLLVDEISLAEDSVLERLNPLFEEDRALLLSDAGVDVHSVSAAKGYEMIATMNPGGDYGKKELSKALRNRFTEVWSSNDYEGDELVAIFDARLDRNVRAKEICQSRPSKPARAAIAWIAEFFHKYSHVFRHSASVRDVVACADLFAACLEHSLEETSSLRESLAAVFLDALAGIPTRMNIKLDDVVNDADTILSRLLDSSTALAEKSHEVRQSTERLTIGPLSVAHGPLPTVVPKAFSLKAPTCVSNFYRIARGLLINKPILLEGGPGCGKSSTVMALAQLTGHPITRLNLSDQTDLSDLFGSDVPVVMPDGTISFRWEDGPVLRAIKRGEWVLLDEMNLASQSVLEGLNACFDHRRILFIAELNKSFEIPADSQCRFFACQNPRAQGGNRRALPKSFINRFTNIWVDDLTRTDIAFILREVDARHVLNEQQIEAMVETNYRLSSDDHLVGGPFSFNLRDLLRWLQLYSETGDMSASFELLFVSRMRRNEDREKLRDIYHELFNEDCIHPPVVLTADSASLKIGQVSLPRQSASTTSPLRLLSSQTTLIHQLATCVKHNWLALLIGSRNTGKRATVENLASAVGVQLQKIVLNSDTDAQELIGSYEQIVDNSTLERAKAILSESLLGKVSDAALKQIRYAEDLLALEIASEHALSLLDSTRSSSIVEECREAMEMATRGDMRFAWVDSPFVRAFVEGHWLIIEDVNLCSGAVLDRLNSCLENDGKLVISERQSSFEPLDPHPNFRVFLTMDARNGEISRAMRNRSVEIYLDEDRRWNTCPEDIMSLSSSLKKSLPHKVADTLLELSVEKQLHFLVLLNGMSVEEACRSVGVDYSEDMEEGSNLVAPMIADIGTQSYTDWMVQSWSSNEENGLNRLMLCLLGMTPQMLSSGSVSKSFADLAAPFISRLTGVVRSFGAESHHPVDVRFDNRVVECATPIPLNKFVNTVVMEWARSQLQTVDVEKGSAEDLSRNLTKYELSTNEAAFKNLQLIAGFVDAAIKSLKDGSISGEEGQVYRFCLSLLLLLQSCRGELGERAGCAPIYLAWNCLKAIENIEVPSTLRKIMSLLATGWTAEAHDKFVDHYLKIYKSSRLVDPFENEEQNQRFLSMAERAVEENTDSQDTTAMDVDNDEETVVSKRESPIGGALALVERMHKIMQFLATLRVDESDPVFFSQRVLSGMMWRDSSTCRLVRVLSLLNSTYQDDDRVLSIARNGAFSLVYVSFWSSLQFDTSMNLLTVADLRQFAMKSFIRQLWRLAPNSTLLSTQLGTEMKSTSKGVEGWCEALPGNSDWKTRVEQAVVMMDKALPPPDTLDPIVFEEEEYQYLMKKLELINQQLDILAERRRRVSRQKPDCDLGSRHPIIAALFQSRSQLESELEVRGERETLVFRQKASQYTSLCADMLSFRGLSIEIIEQLRSLNTAEMYGMSSDALQIMHSRLQSFTMSAASFKQTVFMKYSSFVDVSMSFVTACDLLLSSIYEVCLLIEAAVRRKDLQNTSAFPIMFTMKPSMDGVESAELLAWCCRDASPMPIQLKSAVVRRRITQKTDPHVDLEWTRRQWQKWYEKNIAKAAQKDFIYKDKTEEEKDELDVIEFFSKEEQDREILTAGDISLLLDASEIALEAKERGNAASSSDRAASSVRYSMALTWIRHVLMGMGQYSSDVHDSTIESDLSTLRWVSLQENPDEKAPTPMDVYRSAAVKEFRRASELLEALAVRTKEVMERWPEVVSLRLILDVITQFNAAPLSTTHMKMATMLENVLEQCEEWEKLADRAHSLRDPLAPLRELLVDWKKMEVRSWSQLLIRCEVDSRQRAQLVAYPLFDAMFKAETPDSLASIVAMCADWLHNATLIDFAARLRTVRSLAEWAEQLAHEGLAAKLRSLAAHFAQYAPLVEKKLKEARDPADSSLADYLKIVKYNDLNLWNIKVSSQKAHTHLFKIIRKFRDAVGVEVAPHFDELLDIDQWKNITQVSLEICQIDEEGKMKRARELAQKTLAEGSVLCDVTTLVELDEQTRSCDETLRTMLNYDQYKEDTEKEKAQGYARNCRQRDVAMVIKEAQLIGLNARKAMTLNQETVTQNSIVAIDIGLGKEKLVRVCAGGRSACIRTSNNANDQLGVSTRKHLTGVVEYGMSWMLKLQSRLSKWETTVKEMKEKREALERIQENVSSDWIVDHESLADTGSFLCDQADLLNVVVGRMKSRLEMVPEDDQDIDASCSSHLHPLSTLHSSDPRLEEVRQKVSHASQLSGDIQLYASRLRQNGRIGVFESSSVTAGLEQLTICAEELETALTSLDGWFERDSRAALELLHGITAKLSVKQIESTATEHSINDALFFIQTVYKLVVEDNGWRSAKTMDRLDAAIQIMEGCGAEKLLTWLSSIVSDGSVGLIPFSLPQLCSVSKLCVDLLAKCCSLMSNVLQAIGVLYHGILSMAMQLFQKGYINTIPKDGKMESGTGETDEAGEGGGMGEGKSSSDAKDVTDEMEETGQIEGLQDDEEEPPTGDQGSNEKPIEMEEDFAEDIQDIDRNEKGNDDEDGEDEEEEEPEAEDQMGDVEDEDEKQLDPKLWDEEEKDKDQKDTDQENDGADSKTEELAAKEDETVSPEEQEKKDDEAKEDNEGEAEEEKEEDVENMDERDREQEDADSREMEKDEIDQPDDNDDKGEDLNMDEEMGEDDTDKEDEETKEGEGEKEEDEEECEADDSEPVQNPGEEDENEEKEEEQGEAMEQGTGGDRRENEEKEEEGGGLNEDEEEEKTEEEDEDKGKGESKSDDRGEAGKGTEAKQKEEKEDEKEDGKEEEEEKDGAEKERQLATEDQELEEAEEGEGEENETGRQMEDAPAATKQMMGAGSMEEARQSKKEERRKEQKMRKQPLLGAEEEMDVPADGDAGDDDMTPDANAVIHLAADDMFTLAEDITKELVLGESADKSESTLPEEAGTRSNQDAERMWAQISRSVNILSAELAENLRLILEPQRSSKMQGDYRTGKRLNMRRLIPYIASEYRKDRIWMRRTKRAQRDYQVLIAVDDSASMNENGIHQVTCESVCSIDDALRRCDAGAVSVCSFGSGVQTICPFGDQMIPGPQLLQKLTFAQSSTDLISLLNTVRRQLNDVRTPTSEQLLIIISDGRGALAQGAEKVRQAVASLQGVTVLFVILDSGPKSISELSVASFQGGSVVLTPYMSLFPFPFYAIVKSVQQLPSVLAESIRQWFELTVQSNM